MKHITKSLILVFLLNFFLIDAEEECIQSNGTTKNLKEIVIGRCHQYFNIINNDCTVSKDNFDCEHIWDSFRKAVVGKEPCDVKIEDFSEFVKAAEHSIPVNRSMFWSGTYSHSGEVAKYFDYWTLEKTLSGYLFDGLSFCSDKNEPDFIESQCPKSCVTRDNPFWNAISIQQAKKTSGSVKVLLSGTRKAGAFASFSTFYRYELPYLDPNVVQSVKVLLICEPGKLKYETCKAPKTLKDLKLKLEAKNITYECEDNPREVMKLICLRTPEASECKVQESINSSSETSSSFKLVFFTVSSLVLLLV